MGKLSRIDFRCIIEGIGNAIVIVVSFAVFAMAFWLALTLCAATGCAAPGARQGTAEVDVSPIVDVAPIVNALADLQTTVEAEATATAALVADQSRRTVEAVQANRDSYVDQSTADPWVARLLIVAIASYPVWKFLFWLKGGVGRGGRQRVLKTHG